MTLMIFASAATATAAEGEGAADNRLVGVGVDLQLLVPTGSLSDITGPMVGPLIRGGYRVIPALEITGRIGYLYGFTKSVSVPNAPAGAATTSWSVSDIPIWVGARYFFMDPPAGFYAAFELALNLMTTHLNLGTSTDTGLTREGFNIGAGYVLSPAVPIDIRAQFTMFNLLGKQTDEDSFLAVGLSVGYSFFF
jgi:hypothetical protein